jgi:manganese transport protein
MQLGFAVVPLVRFTGDPRKMGRFANGWLLSGIAWTIAAVIIGLNAYLLAQTAREWLAG